MPEAKAVSHLPLFVALLAGALGCGAGDESSGRGDAGDRLRVVVARPAPAEGKQAMVLPGGLEPWEAAPLYARVTGYLDSVAVEIGDEVEKEAVLARIVVPEMKADLERARADVASAEAELARENAELQMARVTQSRLQSLRKRERGAVPQQDVDVAEANAKVEEAQVAVARAHLEAAHADHARLQALSSFAEIRAPFAGRITRRVLHPGALVREGTSSDAEPVIEIARTDTLRLVFMVPELLVPHVRAGQPVEIRPDAFPGAELRAKIARTAGALDSATRSMRAEIDLRNEDRRLRPGMYAAVRLTVATDDAGRTVPSRAVRGQGAERYVLVADDGVLRRQPVTVAADDGRRAVIVSGLSGDDLVMVAGSPLAREGTAVEPVQEGGP